MYVEAGRSISSTRCPWSYLDFSLMREEYGLSCRRRRGGRPFLSQSPAAVRLELKVGELQRR